VAKSFRSGADWPPPAAAAAGRCYRARFIRCSVGAEAAAMSVLFSLAISAAT